MSFYSDKDLLKWLQDLNIIEKDKLTKAFDQSQQQSSSFYDILVDQSLISDENLGQLIASNINLPYVNLNQVSIPTETLNIIPELVAKKQQIIAFKSDNKGLHIAINNDNYQDIVNFLIKKTGLPTTIYYATQFDIKDSMRLYQKEVSKAFDDIIKENIHKAQGSKSESDPPVIKLVDTIIDYAYSNRASDIHIEPQQDVSLVRFRVDSILHDIVKLPSDIHNQIVTRIKVMADLRTDEHQMAQDGKIIYKTDKENLDLRISTVPVTGGEKVVMRLLSEESRQHSLSSLGLDSNRLKKLESAYQKPHGMILVTGPTGSGKTTSMYAVLKKLNERNVNIVTIEDPVEYDIEGINQIQVNKKTGLTFSKGLRAIVRQDPDIILVGEIRDSETADIAINAAMTGHLVLSTLHTNDAATTIPRLMDMGVEPFLIASSINIIIAQRLVRQNCLKCRKSFEIEKSDPSLSSLDASSTKRLFTSKDKSTTRIYHGKGCPVCHNTGFVGRIGIFEIMLIDDDIRQAIVDKKSASDIKKIAIKNGMETLLDDGLDKVKKGDTTIEEVLRVTKE